MTDQAVSAHYDGTNNRPTQVATPAIPHPPLPFLLTKSQFPMPAAQYVNIKHDRSLCFLKNSVLDSASPC